MISEYHLITDIDCEILGIPFGPVDVCINIHSISLFGDITEMWIEPSGDSGMAPQIMRGVYDLGGYRLMVKGGNGNMPEAIIFGAVMAAIRRDHSKRLLEIQRAAIQWSREEWEREKRDEAPTRISGRVG